MGAHVATTEVFKYRGFISYCHKDTGWARWVHRSFEGWRIDADLIGRETPLGPIPKKLGPIFRDRDDFNAGQELKAQTKTVLATSRALVLLCSPAAALSRNVNEEIRLFRFHYPERPLIPLIVGGKPGDPDNECFPPALKFELAADGTVTDRPCHLIAADAQDDGDGRDLAMSKVVAQLLGLGTDEVFRRAERERRRQARLRNIVIAALAALTVVAFASAVFAWSELKRNRDFLDEILQKTSGLVKTAVRQANEQGMSRVSMIAFMKETEGLFDGMRKFGRSRTPQLDYREAQMRVDQSLNYRLAGSHDLALDRAQKARTILTQLVQSNGAAYAADQARAIIAVGEVLEETNKKDVAYARYKEALAVATAAAAKDPANTDIQRAIATSKLKIGGYLLGVPGQLMEARREFQQAVAINELLSAGSTPSPEDRFALARSLSYLGESFEEEKDYPQALAHYGSALTMRQKLVEELPDDTRVKMALADIHGKIGYVHKLTGDLAKARAEHTAALNIRRALAEIDHSNTLFKHRLADTLERLAEVKQEDGEIEQAMADYQEALKILGPPAERQPDNANLQRAVASVLMGIAGIQEKDSPQTAIATLTIAQQRMQRLVDAARGDYNWQEDLASINGELERLRGSAAKPP